ncbi:YciI family protein [Kineococcus auxinigenes]|uniref:YciI family protein n=1 Tax=unclassified Kineococcus TaxID=2621656 RepID=UPI003D7DE40D
MPQYLLLIHEEESTYAAMGPDEMAQVMAAHEEFTARNAAAILGGEALESTATATTVRGDGDGRYTVTDGPFAETKEALGGYYVVEAADLDEAVSLARQVPVAPGAGCVEVRPVMTFG